MLTLFGEHALVGGWEEDSSPHDVTESRWE